MVKSYEQCNEYYLVFKNEVEGHAFQINDNNRYLTAMSLTVNRQSMFVKHVLPLWAYFIEATKL